MQEVLAPTTAAASLIKLGTAGGTFSKTTQLTLASTGTSLVGLSRDSAGNLFTLTASITSTGASATGFAGFGPNTNGTANPGLLVTSSTLTLNTGFTSNTGLGFAVK